jgi:hypothetical protein
MRLIHGPTVTSQFPCLEDYGNFNVLRKMDETQKAYPNSGDSKAFEALLVYIYIFFFGREIFEFSRQKDFETLRQLEETLII